MRKLNGKNDVGTTVAEYTRLVLEWAEQQGNVRKANAIITKSTALSGSLAESEAGRDALESLYSHPNDGVRLSAAIAGLKWNASLAIPVLEDIEAHEGYNGFEAKWVLKGYWGKLEAAAAGSGGGASGTTVEPGAPIGKQELRAPLADVQRTARPIPGQVEPGGPAADEDALDAVFGIHSLIMNGGLDHAYEVRGHEFPLAVAVFMDCGAPEAAAIVKDFLAVLGGGKIPAGMDGRGSQLAAAAEAAADEMEILSDRYFRLSDVQDRLEAAG